MIFPSWRQKPNILLDILSWVHSVGQRHTRSLTCSNCRSASKYSHQAYSNKDYEIERINNNIGLVFWLLRVEYTLYPQYFVRARVRVYLYSLALLLLLDFRFPILGKRCIIYLTSIFCRTSLWCVWIGRMRNTNWQQPIISLQYDGNSDDGIFSRII